MKNSQLHDGFTIVELLIVIVMIAILAAIALVAYNGILDRATDSALQFDLSSAGKKIQSYYAVNGLYPSSTDEAEVRVPANTEVRYTIGGDAFCLIYTKNTKKYSVTQNGRVAAGVCQAGVVSTFAGSAYGYSEGNGADARFRYGEYVAVDANGVVYVSDRQNHRIRKLTPNGDSSTIAGTGNAGYADGSGATAQFNQPAGIAVDKDGVLYVADRQNHRIRKIMPNGDTSTLAGSGAAGAADGQGVSAQFNTPIAIAVDGSGSVYVTQANCVRKITSSGFVSTFAGTGASGSGATIPIVGTPQGIAVDATGNIYVSSGGIIKVTPAGDGYSSYPGISGSQGVAVDQQGYIYAATGHGVSKVTPEGNVSMLAGDLATPGYVDGIGTAARFNTPMGIAVDKNGVLYVGDRNSFRIRSIK